MSEVAEQLWSSGTSKTRMSLLLFIYSSMVLTKAAWALVSVTVSEVPAIMIAGTMAIVAVL